MVDISSFDRSQSSECASDQVLLRPHGVVWDIFSPSPAAKSAGAEGGGVHGPSPHAPCLVDQLSHQFCRVSLSLFSLRVTCGDPPDCFLCALLSALSCVTASWLKVKESIISSDAVCQRAFVAEKFFPLVVSQVVSLFKLVFHAFRLPSCVDCVAIWSQSTLRLWQVRVPGLIHRLI